MGSAKKTILVLIALLVFSQPAFAQLDFIKGEYLEQYLFQDLKMTYVGYEELTLNVGHYYRITVSQKFGDSWEKLICGAGDFGEDIYEIRATDKPFFFGLIGGDTSGSCKLKNAHILEWSVVKEGPETRGDAKDSVTVEVIWIRFSLNGNPVNVPQDCKIEDFIKNNYSCPREIPTPPEPTPTQPTTPTGPTIVPSTLADLAGTIDNKVGLYYKCIVAGDCSSVESDALPGGGRLGVHSATCFKVLEKSLSDKETDNYINYLEDLDTSFGEFPYYESYTIKPNLARAFISVESAWNPTAKSLDGKSFGIMQVGENELRGKGYPQQIAESQQDIFDSWQNPQMNTMRGSSMYNIFLKNYVEPKKCENPVLSNTGTAKVSFNEALAVASYNTGPGRVECNSISPPETINYTALVLAYYRMFAENYEKYKANPQDTTICTLQGLEVPPVEEIPPKLEPPTTGCGILCMLSYIDKAFVDQIFKSNK